MGLLSKKVPSNHIHCASNIYRTVVETQPRLQSQRGGALKCQEHYPFWAQMKGSDRCPPQKEINMINIPCLLLLEVAAFALWSKYSNILFGKLVVHAIYIKISLWKHDLSSLWGKTMQLRMIVSSMTDTSLPIEHASVLWSQLYDKSRNTDPKWWYFDSWRHSSSWNCLLREQDNLPHEPMNQCDCSSQ